MNTLDLDDLLAGYRKLAPPSLPCSFAPDVLREIRLRKTELWPGWIESMFVLLRPGMVAVSLSVAIAVGVLLPAIVRADEHPAANSDMDVFSTSSPHFPTGLLAKPR